MIGVLIVAGEIAFWAFVFGGLVARYLLRRPRLGVALLLMTPLVDLALIAATVIEANVHYPTKSKPPSRGSSHAGNERKEQTA